jgi:hypothetical protein
MRPCVFCGSTAGRATDEHVIPKWARDGFAIQDWVTLSVGDGEAPALEQVGRLRHLNIVLKDGLCRPCNTDWLAPVEDKAKAVLLPMALNRAPTALDAAGQALVSFWAVKTVLLLELAIRQRFAGRRPAEGYVATTPEMAWLREREQPPPRSMVWLGCWDCEREIPVNYQPSTAGLPTSDGAEVTGHLATFTLGFVAFQVFTVDFVAAGVHEADVWNTRPPETLRDALPRIWPPQLTVQEVSWPPAMFRREDWHRLVTWDDALRTGGVIGQ